MNAQVIHDQEQFLLRARDQPRQKHDEQCGVHFSFIDHPPHFSLVGDRRYHVDTESAPGHYHLRRVPGLGITTAVLTRRAYPHLVSPVDLCIFLHRTLLDLRILCFEPFIDRGRVLLVGFADRFLWRVTPTTQIFTDGTNWKPLPGLLLDQFLNSLTRPQSRGDLQILGSFAVDELLDALLLLIVEKLTGTNRTPGPVTGKSLFTASFVLGTAARNDFFTNTKDGGNINDGIAKFPSVDGTHPQSFQNLIGLRTSIRQLNGHDTIPSVRHSWLTER